MPGLAALPLWLWRRTSPRVRAGAAVGLLVVVAGAVVLALGLRGDEQERARVESAELARLREQRETRLLAGQRPRFARSSAVAAPGAGPRERLAARAALLDELSATVLADARRRVRTGALDGPVRRVECEAFPRTAEPSGAELDLSRRRGRYFCLAVTSAVERSDASAGVTLGHPYRVLADFATGRFAYCQVAGRADTPADPRVTTPPACGG